MHACGVAGSVFISCSELGGIIGSILAGVVADKLVATVINLVAMAIYLFVKKNACHR